MKFVHILVFSVDDIKNLHIIEVHVEQDKPYITIDQYMKIRKGLQKKMEKGCQEMKEIAFINSYVVVRDDGSNVENALEKYFSNSKSLN